MAGVFASFWCVFGHKWRWVQGSSWDDCNRCGATRVHVPGTRK